MYGAVDLMVVGQFGQPADVPAVSTGSQVMHTVTWLTTGLSMGVTVLAQAVSAALAWLSFFHGDLLAGLFARDTEVIWAADYLRAYAIDTMLTSILFHVGLATPCSTIVQIILFGGCYAFTSVRDQRLAVAEQKL